MASRKIVFVRRQSPDWLAMSRDLRSGKAVAPSRYVPDHEIPGFPDRVDLLIERWNQKYPIDFFSFRAAISTLCQRSLDSVPGAMQATFEDLESAASIISGNDCYVYFHDDDDFFAPTLPETLSLADMNADAVITPLFRLDFNGPHTFAVDGCHPEFIWGKRVPHAFRYQTNNYALLGRHCNTVEKCLALKDHVLASRHADALGFRDCILPSVVSATIKTPGSASALPHTIGWEGGDQHFENFVRVFSDIQVPDEYDWVASPMRRIVKIVEAVSRKDGCEAIADLLGP